MLSTLPSSVRRILHSRIVRTRLASASFASATSKSDPATDNAKKNIKDVREGMNAEYKYSSTVFLDEKWDEDVSVPKPDSKSPKQFPEYGNKPPGLEPTRFGDWQYKGRSTDF